MGKYKIKTISSVNYGKYTDVIRVIATKERGFFASLFSSSEDAFFILSEESPLLKAIKMDKQNGYSHEIHEDSFVVENKNGNIFKVEKGIDLHETKKANRIAEAKRKAEEEKRAKELKAQKEKERLELGKKRKEEEDARRLEEALNNATVHKVSLSDFQLCVDEDAGFSEQMSAIAGNVNLCYATGNKRGLSDNLVTLYNKVHGYNSHLLKTLAAKEGQVVGLAFIKMALFFDNGDFQVNEIAAQNAYYCIAKNFMGANNTYALPALFTLLSKNPQALADELYSVNSDPSLVGFGAMTLSAPYAKRERAMQNRLPIMKYILSKFYDEKKNSFLLDTTLPYHIPSQNDINKFYSDLESANLGSSEEVYETGKEYFKDLYDNIEDQLDL